MTVLALKCDCFTVKHWNTNKEGVPVANPRLRCGAWVKWDESKSHQVTSESPPNPKCHVCAQGTEVTPVAQDARMQFTAGTRNGWESGARRSSPERALEVRHSPGTSWKALWKRPGFVGPLQSPTQIGDRELQPDRRGDTWLVWGRYN